VTRFEWGDFSFCKQNQRAKNKMHGYSASVFGPESVGACIRNNINRGEMKNATFFLSFTLCCKRKEGVCMRFVSSAYGDKKKKNATTSS
jgi:hypothetical protein